MYFLFVNCGMNMCTKQSGWNRFDVDKLFDGQHLYAICGY